MKVHGARCAATCALATPCASARAKKLTANRHDRSNRPAEALASKRHAEHDSQAQSHILVMPTANVPTVTAKVPTMVTCDSSSLSSAAFATYWGAGF